MPNKAVRTGTHAKRADKGAIRTRLKLAFFVLSLGPMLLSGIVLAWQSSRIQLDQFLQQQHEISERGLGRIRDYFHDVEDQLGMAARVNNIMGLDRDRQRKILSGICSYRNEYHGHIYDVLVLLDSRGRELVRVARNRVYADKDLREMTGADEFRLPMKDGKVYYSRVMFDRSTGEPSMTVGMPMIDVRTGRPDGVLVAGIRLKDIWGLVAGMRVGRAGSAYLLDSTGKVIAHKDHSLVLKGTYFSPRGNGIQRGLTDAKAIVDTKQIALGSQRLFLVTERPLSEALALTFRIVGIIGVFLLITLSGVIALGMLVRHQVIGPIESLADTVKAISGGDLTRRAEHAASDEIGVLVDSCNSMTKQLIETVNSLTSENAERKKAEEAVRDMQDRLVAVLDGLEAIVYVADLETYEILFVNKYTLETFGDVCGRICWHAFQSGQNGPCNFCAGTNLLTSEGKPGGVCTWECHNTINGRWYYFQDRAIRWVDDRMVRLAIATDITERRDAEGKIKASLLEKEMLLREIHHRVKNNMQVISSLLDIQAGYVADKAVSEMFSKSRDRIRTMALIHEKLYGSEDMSKIDFAEYLRDLTDYVHNLYVTDPEAIVMKIDIGAVRLDINTAVPVALIVHELFSNALIHAFPPRGEGRISVALFSDETGKFTLVVADNGVGFPAGVDPVKPDSLGMQLVNTLVRQLKGEIEIDRSSGTAFKITFRQLGQRKRREACA